MSFIQDMRPLIPIILILLLASCRSNRQLQSESVDRSTIDTQTSSGTRGTAQVMDLYSAATTIELTDITITTPVGSRHAAAKTTAAAKI